MAARIAARLCLARNERVAAIVSARVAEALGDGGGDGDATIVHGSSWNGFDSHFSFHYINREHYSFY
jgi:hypothetical protein